MRGSKKQLFVRSVCRTAGVVSSLMSQAKTLAGSEEPEQAVARLVSAKRLLARDLKEIQASLKQAR